MKSPDASPPFMIDRTIALVGMMGVGKSTIGRRLAPRLGLPFYDADDEIERAAGMRIADLFAKHGEASFRQGEAQVIERLLSNGPILLATGGGALTTPSTLSLIKQKTFSIWLTADVNTIIGRTSQREGRPLLNNANPRETIERLIAERRDLYAQADIVVDTHPGPHSKTIAAIIDAMKPHFPPQ